MSSSAHKRPPCTAEPIAPAIHIVDDDLTGPEIAALLAEHLADMRANSPDASVHALDLDALRDPAITFWSAWEDDSLAGCVALKELDTSHGEIKSMRTAAHRTRRGIAAMLLKHLMNEARGRGYRRVSLETGSADVHSPARRLYTRHGFAVCPPFADYREDPHSVFMTRVI